MEKKRNWEILYERRAENTHITTSFIFSIGISDYYKNGRSLRVLLPMHNLDKLVWWIEKMILINLD
jgi:hypothetical protein